MEKLRDTSLRLRGMAIQNLIFFLFFYLRLVLEGEQPLWKVVAWQLLFTTLIWEGTRLSIRLSRYSYPGLQQLRQRLLVLAALLLLLALAVGSWHVWMEDLLDFWPGISRNPYSYLYSVGMTLFLSQLIAGVYEALYYLEQWKRSVRETEALEKRNLQTQLESLKNQVTPHFLFNSLNSLSALVEEDPKRAVRFIEELSAIYRYLLQSNEKALTPLARELEFIQAYMYLLKTRFEGGLVLHTAIDPALQEFLIPPLTLQLLVENAVKHNRISEAMPLHIHLYTNEAGQLVVSNTLQKRNSTIPSSKMGLVNIAAKYQLLQQAEIQISETTTHFQVCVPLIPHRQHESIDR